MKKAKFMLAVIFIVGFLFAAKTKPSSIHYIYTGQYRSGVCTTKVEGRVICNGPVQVAASTTPLLSGCPDVFTCVVAD